MSRVVTSDDVRIYLRDQADQIRKRWGLIGDITVKVEMTVRSDGWQMTEFHLENIFLRSASGGLTSRRGLGEISNKIGSAATYEALHDEVEEIHLGAIKAAYLRMKHLILSRAITDATLLDEIWSMTDRLRDELIARGGRP